MNTPDAQRLWARLREAGVVDGEAPVLDVDATTPWPVRWLNGAGAWVSVPLLVAFVMSLIDWQRGSAAIPMLVGAVFIVASLPWLRSGGSEYQRQAGSVGNLAGILLVALGVALASEGSANAVAITLLLLAAAMFALSTQWLHRFLCAGTMVGAVFWLLLGGRFAVERLAMAQLLVVWAAMALWLLRLYGDPARWPWRVLDPLAWALTLAALLLAWAAPWLAGLLDVGHLLRVPSLRLATAAALPLVAIALVYPRWQALGPGMSVGLVAATVVLAWLWRWAPGVTVSISLLLLAVPLGASLLMLLSTGSLALSLLLYYFHLDDTLLAKSLALLIAGVIVLLLYLILRARSRRVAS